MNNQEYEQKKHECWEEFCIKNPAFNDMLGRKIFNQIYDRAYTLGQKKEAITQEDIERAAETHADVLKVSSTIPGVMVPMLHDIAKSSYICGAQDTLGKQFDECSCKILYKKGDCTMTGKIESKESNVDLRLLLAAQIIQGVFSNGTVTSMIYEKERYKVAKIGLKYADALILECEATKSEFIEDMKGGEK